MKMRLLFSLSFLFIFSSCSDTTPMDSKFWSDPSSQRTQQNETQQAESKHTYVVHLFTLSSANLGEITGKATIDVDETDVVTSLKLTELPQSLMVGQRSLTHKTCSEIAEAFPPPAVITTNTEFKEWSGVDFASREALMRELNQIDGRNGDMVDLEGKTFVVKAYVETFNTPGPTKGEFIPVACGTITKE